MKTFKLKKGYALYVLLVTVLFTSCGKLNEGCIVKKLYEPARTYTTIEYDVVLKLPMQKIKHDNEDWSLVIEGIVKQDTIRRTISVTHKDFERFSIGDYVTLAN